MTDIALKNMLENEISPWEYNFIMSIKYDKKEVFGTNTIAVVVIISDSEPACSYPTSTNFKIIVGITTIFDYCFTNIDCIVRFRNTNIEHY